MEHSPFEKLVAAQLVKKFLAFYGNRRFITLFRRARYWSLSVLILSFSEYKF